MHQHKITDIPDMQTLRPRLMHDVSTHPDPVSAEIDGDCVYSQSEARLGHDVSSDPDRVYFRLTSVLYGHGRDVHKTVCIVRVTRHNVTFISYLDLRDGYAIYTWLKLGYCFPFQSEEPR